MPTLIILGSEEGKFSMTQVVLFDKMVDDIKDYEVLREALLKLNEKYEGKLAMNEHRVVAELDFGIHDLLSTIARVSIYKNRIIFETANGAILGIVVKVYQPLKTKVITLTGDVIEKETLANDFAEMPIAKRIIARGMKKAKKITRKIETQEGGVCW